MKIFVENRDTRKVIQIYMKVVFVARGTCTTKSLETQSQTQSQVPYNGILTPACLRLFVVSNMGGRLFPYI